MKNIKYLLMTILATLFVYSAVLANSDSDNIGKLFKDGNLAYKNGKYAQAAEDYSKIVGSGIISADVFYNLGNAYFKNNRIGSAILYYEKALKLKPRDNDIKFNLDLARRQFSGILQAVESPGQWMSGFLSINELTVIAALIYFSFSTFFILYVFMKKDKYLWILSTLGFFLLCAFVMISIGIYQNEFIRYGIITVPSAELRSGPNLQEDISSIATEGTKARVLRKEEDWIEIRVYSQGNRSGLSSGTLQGWIPEKDLTEI